MASSCCAKCGNLSFELKENAPQGSRYKLLFVQCSSCGAVVGVLDYDNIGAVLRKQNEAIKRIASAAGVHVDL